MAHSSAKDGDVPSWDGSPNTFERFATDCRWYSFSLKQSERHLAAPRVWHKLSGSAKSVVRNLNPEQYATANGLDKLFGGVARLTAAAPAGARHVPKVGAVVKSPSPPRRDSASATCS